MPKPKPTPTTYEVADPAEAFRKLEAFTRQMMTVPKARIDKLLAKEKAGKSKRKSR